MPVTAALPASIVSPADEGLRQSLLRAAKIARPSALIAALDIGSIDLPPSIGTEEDGQRVRNAAPLYFASELESARLLPAVELLSRLWATGAITSDLGSAGELLTAFYRQRNERLTAAERDALFGRMFGKPYGPDLAVDRSRNPDFESELMDVAVAISDSAPALEAGGLRPVDRARLGTAAQTLAASLSARTGGVTVFAAQELIDNLTRALSILGDRSVQQAVGARSTWDAVRTIARRWMNEEVEIESHVTRARTGLAILEWVSTVIADPSPRSLSGSLVTDAIQWMQATLALHERSARPSQPAGA